MPEPASSAATVFDRQFLSPNKTTWGRWGRTTLHIELPSFIRLLTSTKKKKKDLNFTVASTHSPKEDDQQPSSPH
jgi:hypothetical protein